MKYIHVYALFLMSVFHTSCGQNQTNVPKDNIKSETKDIVTSCGPNDMVRNIKKGRNGTILIAAATSGVFRYDGKSFINLTSKVGPRRFWDVLEDRRGNLWFASTDSGVYFYDGTSFQHFTTREGLLNNEVTSIYEDKKGNIWFGVSGGASCYDGNSFRNYIIDGDAINEDRTGKTFPNRRPYGVSSIFEDKTGKFWFATRDNTFVYDGKTFTALDTFHITHPDSLHIVLTHEDKPFENVRSIIEDKKGNIWLGGPDGLLRYDGRTFTMVTQRDAGSIIEDNKGNIWTTGAINSPIGMVWALSRYDAKSLYNKKPTVTEINVRYRPAFLAILEANDGSIWYGASDGVYRYDGKTITDFKGEKDQQ